jgi:hypothetical protein
VKITQPSILAGHFFRIFRKLQGIQEFLDLAIQHIVQVVDGQADPVVGDPALGKIVSPDLCAPVAGTDEAFPMAGDLLFLFPDLFLV